MSKSHFVKVPMMVLVAADITATARVILALLYFHEERDAHEGFTDGFVSFRGTRLIAKLGKTFEITQRQVRSHLSKLREGDYIRDFINHTDGDQHIGVKLRYPSTDEDPRW